MMPELVAVPQSAPVVETTPLEFMCRHAVDPGAAGNVVLAFKVSVLLLAIPVPPLAAGRIPVTPVVSGKPVRFVAVPDDGVPSAPFNRTTAPADPVLTASAVATPVPNPLTPVEIGRPVPLVRTTAEGVPSAGVTKVGDVARTALPVPVVESGPTVTEEAP